MTKKELKKQLFLAMPLSTCILFIFFDSIPFYFFSQYSFNTQFGLTILYCWICMNPDLLRPIVILFLGLLIDLFHNYLFGFTSVLVSLILFIQKRDTSNLIGKNFKITWLRFFIFILIVNILSSIVFKLLNSDSLINSFEFFYTIVLTSMFFPFIFYFTYYLNNKIVYYAE